MNNEKIYFNNIELHIETIRWATDEFITTRRENPPLSRVG